MDNEIVSPREKLQCLLRELFQFDSADIDFGIYRIMNMKRDAIDRFIKKDLLDAVNRVLSAGALSAGADNAAHLKEITDEIHEKLGEDAINGDGVLADNYRQTNLGKRYLQIRERDAGTQAKPALEAQIFNHLYAFFNRYYDKGDFISKRRYSRNERYAIPYNGEEVYLYWANKDQYYVKTGEYFTDYRFKVPNGLDVHFRIKVADIQKDDVKGDKRFFVPLVQEATFNAETGEIDIPFEYRPLTQREEITYGQRNQQDAIITEALQGISTHLKEDTNAVVALMHPRNTNSEGREVSCLEHHLRQYTRRNTSDFFVHKHLKAFLSHELDFYLKNEVLNVDELGAASESLSEGWFQTMQAIKTIGARIIEFLAQIEEFQKELFEKKKFITETQYLITLNNIPSKFHPEIAGCDAQWDEWRDLFKIDEEKRDIFTASAKTNGERRSVFLATHPTLVLDTKHFNSDFKDRLLAVYDDLDEITDGLLIHSENFQALNLLLQKYVGSISVSYADPPYNTNASEILYKNDYKHSSWLTLLENRMSLCKSLMSQDGVLCITIDDFEAHRL